MYFIFKNCKSLKWKNKVLCCLFNSTQILIIPLLVWNDLFYFALLSNVNKSYWLLDSSSGTISINQVTTPTDLRQPPTIASATDKVATYQDTRLRGLDPHIHTKDDHTSPVSTMGFILLGSFSSLCIIGCILFIRSQ